MVVNGLIDPEKNWGIAVADKDVPPALHDSNGLTGLVAGCTQRSGFVAARRPEAHGRILRQWRLK
jgi:hypothetical protein